MLEELGCEEAEIGSKFDQLMALPDIIRLGEKTPFELKAEGEIKSNIKRIKFYRRRN